jgi:hypothetical protein
MPKGSIADARYMEAVRGKLKIIAIKETQDSTVITPSVDTIRDQTFPISVPLVLNDNAVSCTSELRVFVNFCVRRGLGPQYARLGGATTVSGAHRTQQIRITGNRNQMACRDGLGTSPICQHF